MKFVIIGLGGIGGRVADLLDFILTDSDVVMLVDGDKFEYKNKDRQAFTEIENKALHVAKRMKSNCIPVQEYISDENAERIITEGTIVFSCVDNHATRKLVSKYAQQVQNCILISGGNDLTDGNVQVFIRQYGNNFTEPIEQFHKEIDNPEDRNPADSCEAHMDTTPQIVFANNMAAAIMCNAYYKLSQMPDYTGFYSEAYFDILQNKVDVVSRQKKEMIDMIQNPYELIAK